MMFTIPTHKFFPVVLILSVLCCKQLAISFTFQGKYQHGVDITFLLYIFPFFSHAGLQSFLKAKAQGTYTYTHTRAVMDTHTAVQGEHIHIHIKNFVICGRKYKKVCQNILSRTRHIHIYTFSQIEKSILSSSYFHRRIVRHLFSLQNKLLSLRYKEFSLFRTFIG